MKIVINTCYGGFSLSKKAYKELGIPWDDFGFAFSDYGKRNSPELIACVKKLGKLANGRHANLKIIEIPDDIEWEIYEYDGIESIHKKHQSWY